MNLSRRTISILATIILLHIVASAITAFVIMPAANKDSVRMIRGFDEYHDLAINLLEGNGFAGRHGEQSVIRGPGYPALLATVFYIAGEENYQAVQILQIILSAGIIMGSFFLARRLANDTIALWTAALLAFNPALVWFTSRFYIETFLTFLLIFIYLRSISLVEIPRLSNAIVLGLLFGIVAYVKSIVLIFILPLFILLLMKRIKWPKAFGLILVVGLCALIIMVPWMVRNYDVSGEFIPMHASLAFPLLSGHHNVLQFPEHPFSYEVAVENAIAAFPVISKQYGYPEAKRHYRSLQEEIVMDKAARKFMLDVYTENPLFFIYASFIRFLQFWYLTYKPIPSLLMLAVNLIVLILCAVGWRKWNVRENRRFLVFFSAIWVLAHAVIIGQVRMIVPILPLLMPLAAMGVHRLYMELSTKFKAG